jgi:tellurite resistance protein TehA-like permease
MQHPLRRLLRAVVLGRFVAELPCGSFAFVMATGIVSIAAALNGMGRIANLRFILNLFAFPVLWLLLLLRLRYHPCAVLADLQDYHRGPSLLTIVAGTCILGDQVSLLTAHQVIAAALWVGAAIVWAVLIYCPFALTIKPMKPPLDAGIDGSWLLVVVASEALAISATHAVGSLAMSEPVVLASLSLFALGSAFYVILLMLIVYRWLFWPLSPDQFGPLYWINMGAAAITALAGARLLPLVSAEPVFQSLRGFVVGETLLFWSLATWWIPWLCGLTIWSYRAGAKPLGYRLENWSIVFPLGMYTTASWNISHVIGLPFLMVIPQVFAWVAIAAWCLTFAGMLRRLGGWHRRHGHVVPSRPEGG